MSKAPSHSDLDLRPGQLLEGKYRVERILGAGGMGVVVAAHHVQLDEKVAIKFLHPRAVRDQETMARFLREARAAVKIKSEHVARVLDVGSLSTGAPYMVLEYLEGNDLAKQLRVQGPPPVSLAVDFVLQTCDAIANAHALGIVHRDLKPANLFCTRATDGSLCIKVLDFGISKLTQEQSLAAPDRVLTSTQAVMGSPHYMSPEQMQSSKAVDARTDVWSLGVILFELLTGRVPFDASTMPELVIKIVTQPAPSLTSVRRDVPEGLAAVVSQCLEKERERRYASVGALARALAPFAPVHVRPLVDRIERVVQRASAPPPEAPGAAPIRAAATPAADAPVTEAPWGRSSREKRSTKKTGAVVLSASGVLVLMLGAGAIAFLRKSPAPAAAPVPSMGTGPSSASESPPITPSVAPSASVVLPPMPSASSSAIAPLESASPAPPQRPHPGRPSAVQPSPRSSSNVYNEM